VYDESLWKEGSVDTGGSFGGSESGGYSNVCGD
jgi:hypothetical protein